MFAHSPNADFKAVGQDVLISNAALIIGPENVEIGDNVRIDAGVIILAKNGFMKIGSHVHIAAGSIFQAGGGITIADHAQIAAGCRFVSASDELDGSRMVGPCVPENLRKVWKGPISIGRLCTVGVNCVVLPAVEMKDGSVLGANSMAKAHQVIPPWTINYGSPASWRKTRNGDMAKMAEDFEREYAKTKKNS